MNSQQDDEMVFFPLPDGMAGAVWFNLPLRSPYLRSWASPYSLFSPFLAY